MPVLADIKKTQEELGLALAELDRWEANINPSLVAQQVWQTRPNLFCTFLYFFLIIPDDRPDALNNRFSWRNLVFSIEAAVTNFQTGSGREQQQRSRAQEDQGQLRARVQFLTQENEELAQVNTGHWTHHMRSWLWFIYREMMRSSWDLTGSILKRKGWRMILRSLGISGILLPKSWVGNVICLLSAKSYKLMLERWMKRKLFCLQLLKILKVGKTNFFKLSFHYSKFRGKQGFKQSHGEDFQRIWRA